MLSGHTWNSGATGVGLLFKRSLLLTPSPEFSLFLTAESFAGEHKDDMVFSSDLLDALTQDFFARKGNNIEEPLHVEDIKVKGTIERSRPLQ